MLARILHDIAAHPRVYDQVQLLAGAEHTRRRLAAIVTCTAAVSVLDLGGGTGLYRDLWPSASHYVCLDIDMIKLRGLLDKRLGSLALCADAAQVPLVSASVDVVMCTALSHHLPDWLLKQAASESARVLKGGGTFIFMDAVWQPGRPASRLLWKHDRGSYPRSADYLRTVLSDHYRLVHEEQYSVFHEYLLCVGAKR